MSMRLGTDASGELLFAGFNQNYGAGVVAWGRLLPPPRRAGAAHRYRGDCRVFCVRNGVGFSHFHDAALPGNL